MVDRAQIDITMSTIVALIVPASEPTSIDQKDIDSVLTRPLTIGQGPAGLLIGSQRDQVEVIAGPNRIEVRDLSGRSDFALRKIPTVLGFFVKAASSKLISYGINFILAVPCSKPDTWITDNVLARDISEKTGKTLLGGGISLKVSAGEKVWRVKLDPTENDHLTVDFNASQKIEKLPSEEELKVELTQQFEDLMSFLDQLGL